MNPLALEQLCRHYSLADIRLATRNFDDGLVVGRGGFGKVYKGHIKTGESSSTVVAIKRLDSNSNQGQQEFRAEIEMLSKLRHSHLVSLLGSCHDGKEMILVYEYMPHGSVHHHLHNSNTPNLSWMQRLRISIGAARGLDYLHTGAGTKHGVIHRDVKSTNILLDEDFAAKISDFGLAKICPIDQSSTYIKTRVKGTFGYLDPHSVLTGKVTRKTDVFAFGVVLFELLSGRLAVFPDEDLSLATWAQNCVKRRNFDQVVDAEIRGQLSPKSLKVFAQMAYRCVHMDPKERPTMSEVVVALQLSLALQEKFNNSAKPSGLIGFTWKMPSYFVLPIKENSGHGDKKPSRNSRINISCSSVPAEDGGEQILANNLKIFSYTDLEFATRNFRNTITTWRGEVFKGWVHEKTYSPSDRDVGLAITVKDLGPRPEWDVQLLGEFGHPNLHRLLGYCFGDDEILYLVHEFMEKRSLKDYLHKDAAELPLITRVKIAVGVARGLIFLNHKRLIVCHWILDTNDIWLDKDFNAKLIYFDVACLVDRLPRSPFIDSPRSWERQCNAFGLGMLLMEILTGRPFSNTTQMYSVEIDQFSCKVANMSKKMIVDVVDPRIRLDAPQIERARGLLSLIVKCIQYPYTMVQALEELEQIYNVMTKT